jgi:hypothetical protein
LNCNGREEREELEPAQGVAIDKAEDDAEKRDDQNRDDDRPHRPMSANFFPTIGVIENGPAIIVVHDAIVFDLGYAGF